MFSYFTDYVNSNYGEYCFWILKLIYVHISPSAGIDQEKKTFTDYKPIPSFKTKTFLGSIENEEGTVQTIFCLKLQHQPHFQKCIVTSMGGKRFTKGFKFECLCYLKPLNNFYLLKSYTSG